MWELSMEESLIGEENFHEGGAGFSSIKKNERINMKKVFLTESKEQP